MFKNRSKFLLILVIVQFILGVWALVYFNYIDSLSYADAISNGNVDLSLLIKNIYTSSWWALIIFSLNIIWIFSLVSYIYNDLRFQFMTICLWVMLFILGIDFKASFLDFVSLIFIFIPIIVLNIVGYFKHEKTIG